MPMPETPKTVRQTFDQVVDKLNSCWNLRLPRLHGGVADSAENDGALRRRITSRIRFLCFRPQLNLQGVLDDFEEKAEGFRSNWVFKPLQEAGTLPGVANKESSQAERQAAPPLRLTSGQQEELLCYLDKLLDDEYRLSRDSAVYERSHGKPPDKQNCPGLRPQGHSPARPTTPDTHNPPTSSILNSVDSKTVNSTSTASLQNDKKRSPSRDALEVTESPTKRRSTGKKRQVLITDSFRHVKKPSSGDQTSSTAESFQAKLTNKLPHLHGEMSPPSLSRPESGVRFEPSTFLFATPSTSFHSNGSLEPPDIFTPQERDGTSSNETSFHSTDPPLCSPDLYPCTQDTVDALNRSFSEATQSMQAEDPPKPTSEVPYLLELSTFGPLCEPRAQFPPDFSFRKRYELLRMAQNAGLNIADLIASTRSCGDDYQKLWAAASIVAASAASKLPERGSLEAWEAACGTYQSSTRARSVIFSGALEWNKPGVRGLFRLTLQPLKLEDGCRFHRAYGADRFFQVSMPSLVPTYLPDHLKRQNESVHACITEWLATGELSVAGRTWRAFFAEVAKRRWKKRTRRAEELQKKKERAVNIQGFKIHLFAVDGIDFVNETGPSPLGRSSGYHKTDTIENFLNWHFPIRANLDSTDCKAFQRFSLGLSQTLPTIVLEPGEFVHIKDQRNSLNGPVMNDGCARMSATLGRAIADHLGLEEVPSVFQARIAGAKGVWMVEMDELMTRTYPKQMEARNFCIEVSDAQLKIKPHPVERHDADVTQRTFEVVDWSTMPRPASLNFQILAVLSDRGVPKEVLTNLLLTDHSQYHDALFQAMNSRIRLREWVEQNRVSIREGGPPFVGDWPDEVEEQIVLLLEHGFMPQDCPHLLERIRTCLKWHLERYVDKLQIRVPQSTYLYCIADPYGVLLPDEVHIGFSGTWKDSVTGMSTNIVDGVDVLVGRLPALLPSDIQRRKAVWRKELHHFRNVVVFPSTGNCCLAEMLAGGDYDGDMPWVCWDQKIVEPFQNVPVPTDLPSKVDCNLENKARDMSTIFGNDSSQLIRAETEDFFRGCFRFNLHPPLLGTCTLEHEKVSYHEGSLSHDGAKKLAALASYLVDSGKQGYFLSNRNWQKFRNLISPRLRDKPAYKENEKTPVPKEGNVIDFLKFWVAASEKDRTLAEFHRKWPSQSHYQSDPIPTSPWQMTKQNASPELEKVLKQLHDDIEAIGKEWLKAMPKELKFERDGFNRIITSLHQKFTSIQPLSSEHELSARWNAEIGEAFSHWRLLRASCLYDRFPGRKMCWYLAGQDLCRIKINATGPSRTVVLDIYSIYKPDKKVVKRIAEQEEEDAEEVGDY